jgi:hypothetical protein
LFKKQRVFPKFEKHTWKKQKNGALLLQPIRVWDESTNQLGLKGITSEDSYNRIGRIGMYLIFSDV